MCIYMCVLMEACAVIMSVWRPEDSFCGVTLSFPFAWVSGVRLKSSDSNTSTFTLDLAFRKTLVPLSCFSLASTNGRESLTLVQMGRGKGGVGSIPRSASLIVCVCMHKCGCCRGWVWFWAAVLEMASELVGGWDSPK